MDGLTKDLITTVAGSFVGVIINGIKWRINLPTIARKKLKEVYLEVAANKTLLEKTAGKDGKGVLFGTTEFKELAAGLTNTETKPLFEEYSTIRHGRIVKGGKKREQINRIQYSLNYTVRQVDDLKKLAKQKTVTGLRLSVRLRTLLKHLTELEKILKLV